MLFSKTAALAALTLAGATSARPNDSLKYLPNKHREPAQQIEGAYIVELQQEDTIQGVLDGLLDTVEETVSEAVKATKLTKGHERFFQHLSGLANFTVRQTFSSHKVFHGASIVLEDPSLWTLDQVSSLDGVLAAWPVRTFRALDVASSHRQGWKKQQRRHPHKAFQDAKISAEERSMAAELEAAMEGGLVGRAGMTPVTTTEHAKRAKYTPPPASAFKTDTFAPHVMTSVDQAHKKGILGQGIKVAVIDTGVDYTHPALGGCFGKGCKVAFGYDVVGDGYSGYNTPVPDDDPYDPCNEHGTHVSGIVGADPNEFNFTGVAPLATLGMYRVFGCEEPGVTQDDVMITAMTAAYEAGADVITLSIGGLTGWTEDAAAAVANRINELGVVVTIAAGNEGDDGLFFAETPAAGVHTWSIGSVEVTELPILRYAVANTGRVIPYYALYAFNVSDLPVYATSKNLTVLDDACNPLPSNTPNLSDYLVVVQRGTCFIDTKYANVAAAGARYVIMANNGNAAFYDDGTADGLVNAGLTTDEDGLWLRRRYINGKKTTVTFTRQDFTSAPDAVGGLIDSFSQYGPTNDMLGQPTMSAPGGNILSTFPLWLGGYGIISGTSMATPATAGAAALYLSAGGSGRPVDSQHIRSIFSTTGSLLPQSKNDSSLIPIVRQGGGMINVTRALAAKTQVYPQTLKLNDTAHFHGDQTIVITNGAAKAKTYTITHEPVDTALTYDAGDFSYPSVLPEFTKHYATVKVAGSITVPAGKNGTLAVTITAPTQNKKRFPVFGGYVVLTSGSEVIRVAYFGLANALHNAKIIDDGSYALGTPAPLVVAGTNVTTAPIQYGARTYSLSGDDYPTLIFRLLMGSPKGSVDLVDADTNFTPTVADEYNTKPSKRASSQTYDSVAIVGNIPEMSGTYWSRNGLATNTDYEITWTGKITVKGKSQNAPDGRYRFLMRFLKITGNGELEDEYESWLSPIIKVERD